MKQGHDNELLELERARRSCKEYVININDLRKRIDELENLQKLSESSENHYKLLLNDALGREQSLINECKLYKQTKENLDKEYDNTQNALSNQKHLYDNAQKEIRKLQVLIDDLQLERERYRKDVTLQENSRAEIQLSSLRKELEQTVVDWKTSEEVKLTKEEIIKNLKIELSKEKEKVNLLKTQVALLEDRMKVALQELSVYRSLDVYHTTMQSELSLYRSNNDLNTMNYITSNTPSAKYTYQNTANPSATNKFNNENYDTINTSTHLQSPLTLKDMETNQYSTMNYVMDSKGNRLNSTSNNTSSPGEDNASVLTDASNPPSGARSVNSESGHVQVPLDENEADKRRRMRLEREKARERALLLELSDTKRFKTLSSTSVVNNYSNRLSSTGFGNNRLSLSSNNIRTHDSVNVHQHTLTPETARVRSAVNTNTSNKSNLPSKPNLNSPKPTNSNVATNANNNSTN